jgi:type II secretory pathway component GspD/PulD (secretin)
MKSKMLIATLLGCLVWQQGVLSQTDATTTTDTNQNIGTSTVNLPTAPAVSANESPAVAAGSEAAGASATNPPAAPAVSTNESPAVAASSETAGASATNPPAAPAVSANESPAVAASSETAGASATNPPAAPAVFANEPPSVTPSNATTDNATTGNTTTGNATTGNTTTGNATTGNATTGNTTTGNATPGASSSPQAAAPASIPLIQFQDVPITTAIENLARQAGINYLLDPKIGYGQPDANGQVKPEPTLSIRWENITAGQALVALLDNYGLQITEDRKTHISRVTTKDPTAPPTLSTRVIQLKYASTSNMVESVQASLTDKRSKVLPDVRTSQLVVVATDAEQEAVDTLINQLDKPTRQVLIETKLVQISSNPSTTKGVDWSSTLEAQHVSFGNGFMAGGSTTVTAPGVPGSGTTPGGGYSGSGSGYTKNTTFDVVPGNGFSWNTLSGLTPGIGFLSADGASAVLHFLNATYDAQITSTPRVVTLDNQMATIEVTRTFPIINLSGGTANSAASSSITYSNVGTILQVTPRISANDFIWLKVIPVVSSFFGNITVTVPGGGGNPSFSYPVPEFDMRKIDSQVMIPNGNTLVMGGLVQNNPTASYSKVPVLGDIPGLGWAFRSESKTTTKDNLIIFLTPTIIKNSDYQTATSAASDFLQSTPAVMKSGMNPNTIWDGSEPRGDWSNPAPMPGEFDKR